MRYKQQGDVLLKVVDSVPAGAVLRVSKDGRHVLALGEATGHSHCIDASHCDVYDTEKEGSFLCVRAPSTIRHEEHKEFDLEPGTYRLGIVREVDPFTEEIRSVKD